uniref:THAP domain-containing protein 9 n=1 Tax=Melanaphis sacchari TaxID=742174 RepID=A0A2H8TGP6_9HEMI
MRQLKLGSGKNITPELRKFALTLHYYSPSAYLYIRKIFSKALPDISTIRKWYTTINGLPGLTRESFQAISIKVNEMKNIGKQLYGCLIIDEMSIKQHVQWTGSRHQGYVDYGQGGGTDSMDNLPYAKDVFVIMVVGLNTHWKVPIAYYLVNGISAEEKSNIINSCLHQLHETGIIIKTITFDGAANNMSMASLLGANLNYADLKPNFKHPLTEDNVHIVLDPCHMVKLIRNCLGDWGLLFDKNNKPIKWIYFKHLVDMQNVTGLHAATKIRTRHIHYHREKMKVRLATQVFSNSVADALEYCCKDLKNKLFENAEATIEFCRRINNIFDLLNSRNFLSKSPFNKPLSDNFLNLNIFIDESIDYLNGIQCLEKPPINLTKTI